MKVRKMVDQVRTIRMALRLEGVRLAGVEHELAVLQGRLEDHLKEKRRKREEKVTGRVAEVCNVNERARIQDDLGVEAVPEDEITF